jgi:hypothetical protein
MGLNNKTTMNKNAHQLSKTPMHLPFVTTHALLPDLDGLETGIGAAWITSSSASAKASALSNSLLNLSVLNVDSSSRSVGIGIVSGPNNN